MIDVWESDLRILLFIFGAYIAACMVIGWANYRDANRPRGCEICGGDEHPEIREGGGDLSSREIMQCGDCGHTREV